MAKRKRHGKKPEEGFTIPPWLHIQMEGQGITYNRNDHFKLHPLKEKLRNVRV